MPQIIIYLDEESDKKVKEYSDKNDITRHDGILRLIKLGLNNKEVKDESKKTK
jgi:hypothetical protein